MERPRGRLFVVRGLRGFAAGGLSVALAVDLAARYSALTVGVVLGVAIAAASVWSLAADPIVRRLGRRPGFMAFVGMFALGGALLYVGLDALGVVVAAALLGGLLAGSSDIGPLPTLEQAVLASASAGPGRTSAFATYNVVGYLAMAAGSIAAGPLTALGHSALGSGSDVDLLSYAVIGLVLAPIYWGMPDGGLTARRPDASPPLDPTTRSRLIRLSTLFGSDAFAGGLITNALVTLWLRERFGASETEIGLILGAALLAAAGSLFAAVPLARRFGLLNTMVFTHLPSSALLIAFAFAPGLGPAAAVWIGRATLSQMDVPTRQAYVQALVGESGRTAAAGFATAARSPSALGGPVTGAFLAAGGPWTEIPIVLAGAVKIVYDVTLYGLFRRVPTEEPAPRPGPG